MTGTTRFIPASMYNARWPFAILFVAIFLLIHLRQNSHNNYNCEICSDKAGYYMYLPAAFQLSFNAKDYPANFDSDHGDGFVFDSTGKVVTKFTSGVALLQAPFYAIGSAIAFVAGITDHPYSRYFLLFINIGLAFYSALGLYCMKKWLEFYVEPRAAMFTTLITFFGTHLYYYTLDESLMSHAYSFFLFSVTLYMMKLWLNTSNRKYFVLMTIALSVAILVRPTNILFALIAIFMDVQTRSDFIGKLRALFRPVNIAIAIAILFLVFLPQMMYWHFAFGKYIVWSYANEGFFFWKDPYFLTVWFSANSGLFPYTPILLFTLLIAVAGIFRKKANAILILVVFVAVSYMCASWSNPWFGSCNFGKRPFVEYLPILMLPVSWTLHEFEKRSKWLRAAIGVILFFFVAYNITLFDGFDTCYTGGEWDWAAFRREFGFGLGD